MKIFITGISGQDGSYLAELLLNQGHEVHGLVRRTSNPANLENLKDITPRIKLYLGDIRDTHRMSSLLRKVKPDAVVNLAGQSHVGSSFDLAEESLSINGNGAFSMMQATYDTLAPDTRFIQACTADMFADVPGPHNEETPLATRNPYACGKILAYYAGQYFRNQVRAMQTNVILFNHESPRRPETFVTRKVTRAVADIHCGFQNRLVVGNLDTSRDWGFAGDTVRAMSMLLQAPDPRGDYVVATGKSTTLREFVAKAFAVVELDWEKYTSASHEHFRADDYLNKPFGDFSKLQKAIGWEPLVPLDDVITKMVRLDIERARG